MERVLDDKGNFVDVRAKYSPDNPLEKVVKVLELENKNLKGILKELKEEHKECKKLLAIAEGKCQQLQKEMEQKKESKWQKGKSKK